MDNNVFDTAPFAYVGNNKYYQDLTDDEKSQLKALKNIKPSPLPSSEEVEESSASVVGQMIPQPGLEESTDPDINDVLADVADDEKNIKTPEGETDMYIDDEFDLLKESLNDIDTGASVYFEASKFIESLKSKFKKDDVTSEPQFDKSKVIHAAKVYTTMRLAGARVKLAVAKNSKIKGTAEYRDLQRKLIAAEKEYRKCKKELSKDEVNAVNEYIAGFDSTFNKKIDAQIQDIKDAKAAAKTVKESVKVEGCKSEVVTEKDLDPEMKPLIEKLHRKGYKTTASSSGHNNLVANDDVNKNGVRDERLYSDARLVFAGKYNLGKAPKYWYWKKVDNGDKVDYLDIEEMHYDTTPGGPSKAFQDWKIKYMKSLSEWIDSLPDADSGNNENVDEACATESATEINNEIDTLFESVMSDIEFDAFDL